MQAVVSGFDDLQVFFLDGSFSGGGIGEIVGRLMDDGREPVAEVGDNDFQVAPIMRYDPSPYAGVPDGIPKGKDKLDVGVVFGHPQYETTCCDFEGDGVVGKTRPQEGFHWSLSFLFAVGNWFRDVSLDRWNGVGVIWLNRVGFHKNIQRIKGFQLGKGSVCIGDMP